MIGPDLEHFAEELSAYLDNELSSEDRRIVEARLSGSSQARRLLGELRTTSQLVRALPRHAAPPAISADVHAQLERGELLAGFDEAETAVVTERPGWFPRLSMAAMVAIVAFGGWWMMTDPASSPSALSTDQLALAEVSGGAERINSPEKSASRRREESIPGNAGEASFVSADVESKIAAGATLEQLRVHPFANEPIRLEIPVRYESEQATLMAKLARNLASVNANDLATTGTKTHSSTGAFFYRGKPGVNYNDGSTRQILVRATRSQVDRLLQEVQAVRNPSDVRLKAGSLTLRGSRKAREALTMLASPDGDREAGAPQRTDEQEQLLDDVLVSLGVNPETFLHPEHNRNPEDQPGAVLAMTEKTRAVSSTDPAATGKKSPASFRSKRSLTRPADPSPGRQSGNGTVANTGMSVKAELAGKKRAQPAKTFVTFVIELPLTKNAKKQAERESSSPRNGAH